MGPAVDFVYPQVVIFCETISRRIAFCCRRQQRLRRRQGRRQRQREREMKTETLLISPASVCRFCCSIASAFAWALLIAFPDFGCKGIIMLRMRPVCDPLHSCPPPPSANPVDRLLEATARPATANGGQLSSLSLMSPHSPTLLSSMLMSLHQDNAFSPPKVLRLILPLN